MNAFENLMSKNGVGSPSKTPQKKSVKRLISTIKKGSVMNAFEKLMSKNGEGSPSKPPQKKSVKRLKCRKITSDQKKIEDWLRK